MEEKVILEWTVSKLKELSAHWVNSEYIPVNVRRQTHKLLKSLACSEAGISDLKALKLSSRVNDVLDFLRVYTNHCKREEHSSTVFEVFGRNTIKRVLIPTKQILDLPWISQQ
jgi:hypothetical protein